MKYYNGCLFHKVEKDFLAQTGDPTGTGTGGDSIYKFLYGEQARFFDDEICPELKHSKTGTVAMASAGENCNASQFYFTLRDDLDYLDEKHTFDDIGQCGTRIVVFNLWLNDDGDMELNFDSDAKDILISGAHKKVKTNRIEMELAKNYVASQLNFSLRAYASVLYLHLPENFRIILRGEVVEPHHIANDLIYRECVLYRPQIGGVIEVYKRDDKIFW